MADCLNDYIDSFFNVEQGEPMDVVMGRTIRSLDDYDDALRSDEGAKYDFQSPIDMETEETRGILRGYLCISSKIEDSPGIGHINGVPRFCEIASELTEDEMLWDAPMEVPFPLEEESSDGGLVLSGDLPQEYSEIVSRFIDTMLLDEPVEDQIPQNSAEIVGINEGAWPVEGSPYRSHHELLLDPCVHDASERASTEPLKVIEVSVEDEDALQVPYCPPEPRVVREESALQIVPYCSPEPSKVKNVLDRDESALQIVPYVSADSIKAREVVLNAEEHALQIAPLCSTEPSRVRKEVLDQDEARLQIVVYRGPETRSLKEVLDRDEARLQIVPFCFTSRCDTGLSVDKPPEDLQEGEPSIVRKLKRGRREAFRLSECQLVEYLHEWKRSGEKPYFISEADIYRNHPADLMKGSSSNYFICHSRYSSSRRPRRVRKTWNGSRWRQQGKFYPIINKEGKSVGYKIYLSYVPLKYALNDDENEITESQYFMHKDDCSISDGDEMREHRKFAKWTMEEIVLLDDFNQEKAMKRINKKPDPYPIICRLLYKYPKSRATR